MAEKACIAMYLYTWTNLKDSMSGLRFSPSRSDYGFRYEDTDKITLRVDDKERTPINFRRWYYLH